MDSQLSTEERAENTSGSLFGLSDGDKWDPSGFSDGTTTVCDLCKCLTK